MNTKHLILLAVLGTLSACATESTALNDYEQKLQWVKQADAQADANKALQQGDFRLMALPGRGNVIPGIDVELRQQYKMKCGTKLTPGVTDAVEGEAHLKLLKMARRYTEEYNEVIKAHCKP